MAVSRAVADIARSTAGRPAGDCLAARQRRSTAPGRCCRDRQNLPGPRHERADNPLKSLDATPGNAVARELLLSGRIRPTR